MTREHTPDPYDLVGRVLSSRYVVKSLVDETSLSVVYRATHRVWRRPVAIKVFKLPPMEEEERRQMLDAFVQEGALLTELSERTAAVCQAREVAQTVAPDGQWLPYMVLEWLEGEPLEELLSRERRTGGRHRGADAALHVLAPVARALAVAHHLGIVHRDIKPGNIFVMSDRAHRVAGPTKLLDFGIATVARDSARSTGGPLARSFTPSYGAPEQFDSRLGPVGPWTDVFALALVFVELMTGRDALHGRTVLELALAACDPARRPTPRAFGAHVDDRVENELARALAVAPSERHENAGAFWVALAHAVNESVAETTGTIPIPLVRRASARTWPDEARAG